MPKVIIRGQKEIDVPAGANLLKVIQDNRYDDQLPATCGGQGQCSTCAVRVFTGGGEPNMNENDVLGPEQLEKKWRLSCQIKVTQDVEIEVPGYEVAEALNVDPQLLRDIIAYAAEKIPLKQIPSAQTITLRRLKDLSHRAALLIEGGGDPRDFEALRDILAYLQSRHLVKEIPTQLVLTDEMVQQMLEAFSERLPEEEDEIITYPYFLYVAFALLFFLTVGLGIYSLYKDAPLEEPATPSFTPNPEKAPWYFLGIQELLADAPNFGPVFTSVAIGGVIIPGLFILFLMALPYIEPYLEFWRKDKSQPVGRRLRDRPVTATLFFVMMASAIILTVIGTYFRGPQWEFVCPLPWC
jgi:ferredoxin